MPDLTTYILNLIFGLISAGLVAFSRSIYKEKEKYREMMEAERQEKLQQSIVTTIDEKIEKVRAEIASLKCYIDEVDGKEKTLHTQTIASWAYRITELCELYLERGWMSHTEYMQLVAMYNMYSQIGGNGRVQEIFNKVSDSVDIKKHCDDKK